MLTDSADLLRCLLEGGKSKIAGRLAGALRNIGAPTLADQVRDTMRTAGYTVAETDPFAEPSPVQFAGRPLSPYVGRMRLLWATMRTTVLEQFPGTARGTAREGRISAASRGRVPRRRLPLVVDRGVSGE